MEGIKEFFLLLWLKFVVAFRNGAEFLYIVWKYYPSKRFRRVDLYLLRNYILKSPFRISKEFLMERGERDVYAYGETPLTTLETISRECDIQPRDVVYELGCGRGRTCFWLHFFRGCRVVGVEYIPTFVHIAQKVSRSFEVKEVSFICKDFLDTDISDATVIYFYGICSSTTQILRLVDKCKSLPSGTKLITVSFPMTSYTSEPLFELVKSFPVKFFWGQAQIYLQVRTSKE